MSSRAGADGGRAEPGADERPDPAAQATPPDLRLAGVAIGTWLAALAVLYLGALAAVVIVGTAAAASAAVAILLWRKRIAPARWRWIVVATLLGVVCGGAAAGARVAARDSGPLAELADTGARVEVDLVVRDDPREVAAQTGRPSVYVVPADLSRVTLPDGPATVGSARILVLASSDGWRDLLPGQRVVTTGRLQTPRGGDLNAAVLTTGAPARLVGRPPWTQRAAGMLRAGLQRACAPLADEPGGLLPGLVVGDTSRLDPAVADDFRATGLTHLVAVSGANVAIILGLVLVLARWARAGPRVAAAACGLALIGFVILARPSPSVVRAGAMGAVGLLALATGRSRAATPALCAAVIVLVVVDPALAGHAGFALSVLATGGLLLLAPRWRDALRRRGVPPGIAEALAVPAAAQVACGPVVAALSGTVSLVAMPANLLAVPAIAPATVLGVAAATVSPLWPAAAEFLAWLGGWPAGWLVTVARHGADVPAGAVPWPPGVTGGLLLGALTAALLVAARRSAVRRLVAVVAAAAMLGAMPVRLVATGWPPNGWVAVVCAVGQGDAVVLRTGPAGAVIVDAGPDPVAVDRCLRRLGVRRVSLLVVTHFHADHIGGVDGVFRARRVDAVVTTPWLEPAAGRAAVAAVARRAGSSVGAAGAGWSYSSGWVNLTAIGPPHRLVGTRSDPNNNSLVLRATVREVSVLLAGDAEEEEQRAMLERPPGDLRADVLKVAHHGSAYQEPAFFDAVDPAVAMVSVGAGNRYGHPNQGVLARLSRGGARVVRTDVDGDVAAVRTREGLAVVVRGIDRIRGPPLCQRSSPTPYRRAGHARSAWSGWPVTRAVRPLSRLVRTRRPDRVTADAVSVGRATMSGVTSGSPPLPAAGPGPPALVLVLGDEEFLVSRAIASTVERARASDPEADVREYDAGALNAGEVAEMLSPSLFGGRRVLVLRGGQDARKDLANALLAYAGDPDPEVCLIVAHAGAAKGKALADGLRAAGATVVPAGKLTKHRERVDFVREEFRRHGGRPAEDAAEALLAAVGNDLRELSAACAQLVADTDGRINARAVATYYRGRAEVSGFTVADAAMVGDVPGALEALRWALHVGVDPVPIADALADGVRTVARVASAGRGNAYQLASSLGMPAWKIERAQRQGRGWTPDGLVDAMRVAADCNAAVKGGAEDRGYALEQAVFAVAAARQAGGGR